MNNQSTQQLLETLESILKELNHRGKSFLFACPEDDGAITTQTSLNQPDQFGDLVLTLVMNFYEPDIESDFQSTAIRILDILQGQKILATETILHSAMHNAKSQRTPLLISYTYPNTNRSLCYILASKTSFWERIATLIRQVKLNTPENEQSILNENFLAFIQHVTKNYFPLIELNIEEHA